MIRIRVLICFLQAYKNYVGVTQGALDQATFFMAGTVISCLFLCAFFRAIRAPPGRCFFFSWA